MPKIAICDLLMCWPPDAGAFVDVVNIATRLSRDAEVLLVLPRIESFFKARRSPVDRILSTYTRFFLRGAVAGEFPFAVRHIDFSGLEFKPSVIARRYDEVLSEFRPDKVLVSNGWHLKAHLVRDLGRWNPILRIYAHEFLCTKADGWFFRHGRLCDRNYLEGGFMDYLGCLTCSTTFYMGYPAVRWVQEYVQGRAYTPGYIKLVKEAFTAASTVIVYNQWTADRIRPYNARVKVIPSGVDVTKFSPAAKKDGEQTVVVVPGRVAEQHKGRDFLQAVMAVMATERSDVVFHITGIRHGFTGPNVCERGWFSSEQLPELYRCADIAFIPSIWREPQGIVAVEAMASGLPVVASAVGGLKEIIVHNKHGILVPPGDVDQAVKALCALNDNPELRRRMGKEGRRHCETTFDWDTIFDHYYRPLFFD
jgi:glycosyltransferase involved in cell wall biosynthesis